VPAASAIRGPARMPRRPTAPRRRAVSARESSASRRHPSQVLPLPPRRQEAKPFEPDPNRRCVRTANACRTGHVFVTLPLLTPARKREDAGASPGSLSRDTD
jgi:hypothetical protein